MTDMIMRLSAEESRAVLQRRKRANVLLMLSLFGFASAMFVLSFAHLQMESRPTLPATTQITDQ